MDRFLLSEYMVDIFITEESTEVVNETERIFEVVSVKKEGDSSFYFAVGSDGRPECFIFNDRDLMDDVKVDFLYGDTFSKVKIIRAVSVSLGSSDNYTEKEISDIVAGAVNRLLAERKEWLNLVHGVERLCQEVEDD